MHHAGRPLVHFNARMYGDAFEYFDKETLAVHTRELGWRAETADCELRSLRSSKWLRAFC
jgi:hypothetical protein